ncbi:Hypothetical Protein FCC1311_048382 [Hondaea fermentalgiana]|uniref:Uncharacterized protein n=1 Tax=Hondaea fermentalgiana TaxID=2315210 RepID=A0A2R5GCB4_9STRA|nr:Hypothetical Protein FCC1311_048382 [Hondaea fermentalgiana]|eukprot:GBG28617.1 Hypothetical Protein FCC1311_048382 [Hondaea fermentalgiana]
MDALALDAYHQLMRADRELADAMGRSIGPSWAETSCDRGSRSRKRSFRDTQQEDVDEALREAVRYYDFMQFTSTLRGLGDGHLLQLLAVRSDGAAQRLQMAVVEFRGLLSELGAALRDYNVLAAEDLLYGRVSRLLSCYQNAYVLFVESCR